MAKTTLTKNLRIKLSSYFCADTKYNLERIDSLAGLIQLTTENNTVLKSAGDIQLLPNSQDVGGGGSGGTVRFGSVEQPLSSLSIFADSLSLPPSSINGITNASIAIGAAIEGTKILPTFGSQPIETSDRLRFTNGSHTTSLFQASSGQSQDLSFFLPSTAGVSGQVLSTNGLGALSWSNSTAGALSGLADVSIGTPTGGEFLRYNSGSGLWNSLKPYYTASWIPSDGATKIITHSLGTLKTIVQVQNENNQLIEVDIQATSVSIVQLTATQAPSGTWTILIYSLI